MTTEKPGRPGWFQRLFRIGRPEAPAPPYRVRDDFLSPAERSFFHALQLAAADWAVVCPKVGLGALFSAGPPGQQKGRVERTLVDFLLCDPRTTRPLVGIQLEEAARPRRDPLVEEAFAAAGLPLARVAVQPVYNARELGAQLRAQAAAPTAPPPASAEAPAPAAAAPPAAEAVSGGGTRCSNCGAPMVLCEVKEGPQKGKHFWRCSNYPQCRGVRRA